MSSMVGARSMFNTGACRSHATRKIMTKKLKQMITATFYKKCSEWLLWPAASGLVWCLDLGPWAGSWCQIHTAASYQWAERTGLQQWKQLITLKTFLPCLCLRQVPDKKIQSAEVRGSGAHQGVEYGTRRRWHRFDATAKPKLYSWETLRTTTTCKQLDKGSWRGSAAFW